MDRIVVQPRVCMSLEMLLDIRILEPRRTPDCASRIVDYVVLRLVPK